MIFSKVNYCGLKSTSEQLTAASGRLAGRAFENGRSKKIVILNLTGRRS